MVAAGCGTAHGHGWGKECACVGTYIEKVSCAQQQALRDVIPPLLLGPAGGQGRG